MMISPPYQTFRSCLTPALAAAEHLLSTSMTTRTRAISCSGHMPIKVHATHGGATQRRQAAAICVSPAQRLQLIAVLRHAAGDGSAPQRTSPR